MESLTDIGNREGTDKGSVHSYLPIYEEILGPLSNKPIRLLEIGIGTGASLRMWSKFLTAAEIIGIDINDHSIQLINTLHHPRIKAFLCNQTDRLKLRQLFIPDSVDIIIDDGDHSLNVQLLSINFLWYALRPNGFYFIEDVRNADTIECFKMLPNFKVYDLRANKRRCDDILIILRKN